VLDDCLDIDEAARYLGLDITTVARFVKSGRLRVVNADSIRHRRFSIGDLEAFVERCRSGPGMICNDKPAARLRNPPPRRR
jgi:excisionase family DNA binding protein